MKVVKRNGLVCSMIIILISYLTVGAWAAASENPQLSPVNPDYLDYIDQAGMDKESNMTLDGNAKGLVPGPQLPPGFEGEGGMVSGGDSAVPLPSSYDLRTVGKLTAVRDQGNCGACWTFATYSSLESYLKPAETADFSELNLNDEHGFDNAPCAGGNIYMSAAYLTRWDGPINEIDDPYVYASQTRVIPKKHVQNIVFLPKRTSETDNAAIKQAVMDYGAIYTTYYASCSSCYKSTYKSYYYTGSSNADHAVAIVGWDDNYDKNRFNTPAPGNGAFIFRNSWGTGWGDNGYGYVSYYDSKFARTGVNAAVTAEETTNYSRVYQYDSLGYVSAYSWGSTGSGWGANIFTASSSDPIKAVGFYALSTNTAYQLYVYTGVSSGSPVSGTLRASMSGTIALPGYYTIALPSFVPISSGQKFSVVIKLITPGNNYPVAIESQFAGYSGNATSSSGQSFASGDGISWSDLITAMPSSSANVCLKAYSTGTGSSAGSLAASFSPGSGLWIYNSVGEVWTLASSSNPENMIYSGSTLYVDFGAYGFWKWDGTGWVELTSANPDNMVISGSMLYGDFGTSGIWKWDGSAWAQLTSANPDNMVASGSTLYAGFASFGLYKWDGTAWVQLTTVNPEKMEISGSTLYGDFGTAGLWKWDSAAWVQLTTANPENMEVSGSTLYGDFGTAGLWKWDGTAWVQLTTANPDIIVASGTTLYAGFATLGLYKWDVTGWAQLTTANPVNMVPSGSTLFVGFGTFGIWKWDGSSWSQLSGSNAVIMETSN